MRNKLRIAVPLCGLLAVLVVAMLSITGWAAGEESSGRETITVETMNVQGIEAPTKNVETLPPVQNVTQGDESPEEDAPKNTQSAEEPTCPYELTAEERMAVEQAVMCEAGGEGEKGQMMVAQCILDGAQRNGLNMIQSIAKYQIASTSYCNVTQEVKDSVSKVFDQGERVTEEKADLWYNPALVQSTWHEQQHYVITVGLHRFFWMNDNT